MNNLKKLIFIILVCMLCVSVEAKSQNPKYKIISNSYKQEDINETVSYTHLVRRKK